MVKIDKEKNLLFYNTYVPCDCVNCRNFYAQIKTACKELAELFEKNNIDIEKPWELSSVKLSLFFSISRALMTITISA